MSTAISTVGSVVGLAALPAIALVGLIGFVASGVMKAVSESDKKAINTLEKKKLYLNRPVKSTPKAMLHKYKEDKKVLSESLKPLKLSVDDEQKFTHLYALETSGLGDFIPQETIEIMKHKPSISIQDCNSTLSESVRNLKKVSLDYTVKVAIQSAVDIGFDHQISVKKTLIGTYITTVNKTGQSIVTLANSDDNGVKINADTTGFENGECTRVMSDFLTKLKDNGIELSDTRVKEHWKKEGILNKYVADKVKEISMPVSEQTVKTNQVANKKKADRRRIQNHNQDKLKH